MIRRLKKTLLAGIIVTISLMARPVNGQDLLLGNKIFYSSYLYFKISKKIFIDGYLLVGVNAHEHSRLNVSNHSFAFNQNDFTFNIKLRKKKSLYFGYSFAFYKWNPYYLRNYQLKVSRFGTITFHRILAGFKIRSDFSKVVRLKHDFGLQVYFPNTDKYRVRVTYKAKFYLYNKNWPLRMSPYTQLNLYYFLFGMPVVYFDDNGDIIDYKPSNGLHRMRLKIGLRFRPIKSFKAMSMALYFAINREFNIKGLGNDINVVRPGGEDDFVYPFSPSRGGIQNPYNSYNIFGLQFNFILNRKSLVK